MTGTINKLCEYITKTFIDNKICIERMGGREGLGSIKTGELYMRVCSVIFDFKLEERKEEKINKM